MTVFETLYGIDVSDKLKSKNGFMYLPWSSAWAIVCKHFPSASYKVIKDANGCIYHTDGKTCWVETQVTIEGITREEELPVLNYRNQPIPLESVTSFEANKSGKRCLVKNCALFGLDLSLWNGEELSDEAKLANVKKGEKIKEVQAAIVELCKGLVESGADKEKLYAIIGEYNGGNKNPRSIKSIDVANVILGELSKMVNKED